MLYREPTTVCCDINTKHMNSRWMQNIWFLIVKPVGKISNHWALEGYICCLGEY